ncbi:MAG: pilus assembly protein PilP [Verrucomicrobiota bacterium]
MTYRAFVVLLAVFALLGGAAGCSQQAQPPGPVVKKAAPKPNAAPPAKTTLGEEPKPAPAPAPVYDPAGRRDPFVSFIKTEAEKLKVDYTTLPPLQRYELGELRYVGVIWAKKGPMALVEDAEGKGYTVRVGTKIGRNAGVVTRITESEITVKEEVPGYRGNKVSRESTLQLITAGGNK